MSSLATNFKIFQWPPAKPTKQTPSTDQKPTVQTDPRTYKTNPITRTADNSSNNSYDQKKQIPSTDQESTVQPPDPRTYKANTPSTNQKSTVQTAPTTERSKPHQQTRKQQFKQNLRVEVLRLFRRSTHTFPVATKWAWGFFGLMSVWLKSRPQAWICSQVAAWKIRNNITFLYEV